METLPLTIEFVMSQQLNTSRQLNAEAVFTLPTQAQIPVGSSQIRFRSLSSVFSKSSADLISFENATQSERRWNCIRLASARIQISHGWEPARDWQGSSRHDMAGGRDWGGFTSRDYSRDKMTAAACTCCNRGLHWHRVQTVTRNKGESHTVIAALAMSQKPVTVLTVFQTSVFPGLCVRRLLLYIFHTV